MNSAKGAYVTDFVGKLFKRQKTRGLDALRDSSVRVTRRDRPGQSEFAY